MWGDKKADAPAKSPLPQQQPQLSKLAATNEFQIALAVCDSRA